MQHPKSDHLASLPQTIDGLIRRWAVWAYNNSWTPSAAEQVAEAKIVARMLQDVASICVYTCPSGSCKLVFNHVQSTLWSPSIIVFGCCSASASCCRCSTFLFDLTFTICTIHASVHCSSLFYSTSLAVLCCSGFCKVLTTPTMMHGLHTGPSVSALAVAECMHLEARAERVKFGRLPQASRRFQACRDSEILIWSYLLM